MNFCSGSPTLNVVKEVEVQQLQPPEGVFITHRSKMCTATAMILIIRHSYPSGRLGQDCRT